MNEELNAPGLDIIVPDITKACPCSSPGQPNQLQGLIRLSRDSSAFDRTDTLFQIVRGSPNRLAAE